MRYFQQCFQVADETTAVITQLMKLLEQHNIGDKQGHDANIVATMLAHDIPCLLTHNKRDFARFQGVIQIQGIEA